MEMKEILETATLQSQHVKLNEIEWVIQDYLKEDTITKLAGVEEIFIQGGAPRELNHQD